MTLSSKKQWNLIQLPLRYNKKNVFFLKDWRVCMFIPWMFYRYELRIWWTALTNGNILRFCSSEFVAHECIYIHICTLIWHFIGSNPQHSHVLFLILNHVQRVAFPATTGSPRSEYHGTGSGRHPYQERGTTTTNITVPSVRTTTTHNTQNAPDIIDQHQIHQIRRSR